MRARVFASPAHALVLLIAGLSIVFTCLPQTLRDGGMWHVAHRWALPTWVSAHFIHLGWAHLLPDVLALGALFWVAERLDRACAFLVALSVSAIAVDFGLALQYWPLAWYCGLSGSLHGGFAFLVLQLTRGRAMHATWAWLLWSAGLLKLALEVQQPAGAMGGLLSAWAAFPLAPPAHVYGYVGGSLWALGMAWVPKCHRA